MNKGLARWRLVLGRFSEDGIPGSLDARGQRMEAALDYLYGREYAGRGVRMRDPYGAIGGDKGPGSRATSILTVPHWINEVRDLFPEETVEIIEGHALERYDMMELVSDPHVLSSMRPNMDLLKAILTFKGWMEPETLRVARTIVAQVVEDIRRRMEDQTTSVLWGRRSRRARTSFATAANLDWRETIRRNLRNYDPGLEKLVFDDVRFFSNVDRRLPWNVVLCIDQSGSMIGSVIHSAVVAGILSAIASMHVSLVVFDTEVVDLTEYADDPVEVLMSVQLGGGTSIGKALEYCEGQISTPHRTIVVLVSDFYEGDSKARLFNVVTRLKESGVRLLGLGALDPDATGAYDKHMANELAARGMDVAAFTPKELAEWLMTRMS